jgi:hypothetical protein
MGKWNERSFCDKVGGNETRRIRHRNVARRAMTSCTPFDLPYELHTNRELEFMLTRGKPLAHFSDAYPPEPDEEIIPQKAFGPYVADGTFEMRAFVELVKESPQPRAPQMRGSLHVFYARSSESWRIDAFIAMMAVAAQAGWSEGFERLEGRLLGYSDSQTDAHIEHLLQSPHARDFPWLRRLRAERQK